MRSKQLLLRILSILAFCTTLVLGSHVAHAQAQPDNLGTNFFVAFGANLGGGESENLMALYITSHVPAKGTVEVPALGFRKTFTTVPGAITTVILPSDLSNGSVEIVDDERVISGMAVHITSDSEVAVYGMNHKTFSSDAFMALPTDVLGTEYRAMCYPTSQAGSGGQQTPGEMLIAGVYDSTHVTITPRAKTNAGRQAGIPFTIILNSGDVYMVQGDENDNSNDITGSLIESDQAIAVFSGHKRAAIPSDATNIDGTPSRDHLIEQLPPVSAWGDSALVVPYTTAERPDLVRVVSAEDNNTISVNGAFAAKLNAGDFYEIKAITGVTSINATNPILVGQFMHTSWGANMNRQHPAYGDPALALVFPVEQFTTSYTIVSVVNPQAFTGNFVNIVVDASGVSTMTLDGAPIPASSFKTIAGSNYVYAQIAVPQGTHNLKGTKPFGTTVYALGNVDSYAYTGGTLIKTITPLKTVDLIIDFKDRLLNPDLTGKFDTVVLLKNISSDLIDVYGFPRRTQDTGKFYVTNPNPTLTNPAKIGEGQSVAMTIEFNPQELNRRMHTQLSAKTDHLRAYVVDLYGRGVLDRPAGFSDSLTSNPIDTVDFGLFAKTDPAKDSTIFIGNLGSAATVISTMRIDGTDASNFQYLPLTIPFTVDTGRGHPASVTLRFTPDPINGLKIAKLTVLSKNGMKKEIILIARIETIEAATLSIPTFDTIITCNNEERTITVTNGNDVPLNIDSVILSGANSSAFVITTGLPLSVPVLGTADVHIRFAPQTGGAKSAVATVYTNIPKGTSKDIPLSAVSNSIALEFKASQKVHILGGESTLLPVYAVSDLTPFHANGYTLTLSYDSTYLSLTDFAQDNTMSYFGYGYQTGVAGHEVLTYQCITDSLIWGGGPTELRPLIFLKFTSTLNGEDPFTSTHPISIGFDVHLLNSPIASGPCILSNVQTGLITLDSTCAVVHLSQQLDIPQQVYIEQNMPNPFNPSTVIHYDIPHESYTTLEVTDVLDRPVAVLVDEVKKTGHYAIRFDASNLSSGVYYARLRSGGVVMTRRMILAR
jgi:hypothetical protein